MSNTLFLNVPRVDVGLPTATYTVPTGGAGVYTVRFEATEVPPSGLTVLVKKGASTVFTAPAVTPTQSALQFKFSTLYADADVITVVLSSAETVDAALNNVKTNVSIELGQ